MFMSSRAPTILTKPCWQIRREPARSMVWDGSALSGERRCWAAWSIAELAPPRAFRILHSSCSATCPGTEPLGSQRNLTFDLIVHVTQNRAVTSETENQLSLICAASTNRRRAKRKVSLAKPTSAVPVTRYLLHRP